MSKKRLPTTPLIRELMDERRFLIEELTQVQDLYNKIGSTAADDIEDWLHGLSINSLHDLEVVEPRTCLGDLKAREDLRQEIIMIKHHIEEINDQIKQARFAFVEKQINNLEKKLIAQ